jgi:hypothetical protein
MYMSFGKVHVAHGVVTVLVLFGVFTPALRVARLLLLYVVVRSYT